MELLFGEVAAAVYNSQGAKNQTTGRPLTHLDIFPQEEPVPEAIECQQNLDLLIHNLDTTFSQCKQAFGS